MSGVGRLAGDELKMMIEVKEDVAEIKGILKTMAHTNETANEALQSSRSAHKRLDKIDKIIFWAGTTIIGAIVFLYKNQGG
jgi:hypothetical protein